MRGRIDLLAIDTLVNMLATAAPRVELHIGPSSLKHRNFLSRAL